LPQYNIGVVYILQHFLTKIYNIKQIASNRGNDSHWGAPLRGRRAGSAGELPFAWIDGKAKPAFNVHGSRRELTRQSLVSLDDIK
jgi:hypothetical protein